MGVFDRCTGGATVEVVERSNHGGLNPANVALQFASSNGDNEGVRKAIEQGAEVNAPEELDANVKGAIKTGDFPLHMAAEAGKVETVHLLFYVGVQGANPEYKNLLGCTALHRAASHRHADVVKELISLGADIHATNKIGNTALHIAAYSGFIDVCKILLDAGADSQLNLRNKAGLNPLDSARKLAVKELLRSYSR